MADDENKDEIKQDTPATPINNITASTVPENSKLTLEELIKESKHDVKIIAGAFTELGLTRVFNEEYAKVLNPVLKRSKPLEKVLDLKSLEDTIQKFLKKQ